MEGSPYQDQDAAPERSGQQYTLSSEILRKQNAEFPITFNPEMNTMRHLRESLEEEVRHYGKIVIASPLEGEMLTKENSKQRKFQKMRAKTAFKMGITDNLPEQSDPEDKRCQTPDSDDTVEDDEGAKPTRPKFSPQNKRNVKEIKRISTKFGPGQSPSSQQQAEMNTNPIKLQDEPIFYEHKGGQKTPPKAVIYQKDGYHKNHMRLQIQDSPPGYEACEENSYYRYQQRSGPQSCEEFPYSPHPNYLRLGKSQNYPNYVNHNNIEQYAERLEHLFQPKPIQNAIIQEWRGHPGYAKSECRQLSMPVSPSRSFSSEEGHFSMRNRRIEGFTRVSASSLAIDLKLLDQAIWKISSRLRVPDELRHVRENLLNHFYKTQRSYEEPDRPAFYEREEPGAPSPQKLITKNISPNSDHWHDNPGTHTNDRRQSWETVVSDDYVTETHFSIKLSPRELEFKPFEEDPLEFLTQRSRFLGRDILPKPTRDSSSTER